MLEQMRKHSRSLLIYLLFAIIIVVFVVSFGPQSVGGFGGPGNTAEYAVKVGGKEVTAQEYRQAFLLAGGDRFELDQAKRNRVREVVLDRLIDREVFAQKANQLGLSVSVEEAEDFVAQGKFLLFGGAKQFSGEAGFNYDDFTRFVRYYGFTPASFLQMQQRELQAERVRNFLKEGVAVSPAEVKAEWEHRNTQVNLEYLRFPVSRYEAEVIPTEEEIAAYATANEEALKASYEKDKAFRFSKLPKERKLEVVRVELTSEATEADKAAAVAKLQPLATAADKQPLAMAAKRLTNDPKSGASFAPAAWRREGAANLGEALSTKVMAAEDGALVGPELGEGAAYLVKVLATREGDLAFDQVRLELAEEALRRTQAQAKAQAAAEAALTKAKQAVAPGSEKSLKDVFPSTGELPASGAAAGQTPRAEETGLFSRDGINVEGIGRSAELSKAVWTLNKEQPFHGPVDVAGAYVVVYLKERKDPDQAEFDKAKEGEMQMAGAVKGYQVINEWAHKQCRKIDESNRIEVNEEILVYPDGNKGLIPYKPCTPVSPFGI